MKTAFDKIKAGLDDAVAYAGGDTSRGVINVPAKIDVRAVRRVLHLNQEEFAARFGFGLARLRDWEQGRSAPDSAVRAYLTVIEKNPKAVAEALGAEDNFAEARLAG
ncbi:MAG: type II toxin-antitoxin system MqsA family antitoxin [Mesorhizobium sp.]